jgi:hypothetical protein
MWEQLNRVFWQVKQSNITSIWQGQPHEFFRVVKDGAHLFQGITDGTMSHGEGWHFIQLGRYLERAIATATVLDVSLHRAPLARARQQRLTCCGFNCSSRAPRFEAYCQVYTADLREERNRRIPAAQMPSFRNRSDLLLTWFQVSLQAIGRSANARRGSRPERLAGRLCAALDYGQVDEIMADNIHSLPGGYSASMRTGYIRNSSGLHCVSIEAALAS